MVNCVVPGCSNTSQKGFIMKYFPRDSSLKKMWLRKMGMNRIPTDDSVVCEVHFDATMWEQTKVDGRRKLKSDAVPTIFNSPPIRESKRKKPNYVDESSESEEIESDLSDPSYVASNSDLDVSEDDLPMRTRSGVVRATSSINRKKQIKLNDDTTSKTTESTAKHEKEKVYNPFSQKASGNTVKQPVHPDVKLVPLPFYDQISELLKPTTLKTQQQQLVSEQVFEFYLTPFQTKDIINSRVVSRDGLCDFEKQVQLRFCQNQPACEQCDYFPLSLVLKVNSVTFPLPTPLPSNKPDQPSKRPPRPLNITPLVLLSATMPNVITVYWAEESGPGFVINVNLVKKLTAKDLLDRLKKKGARHADHTRALIKEKLAEDDNEIMTTHLRVSLMCPLGRMRIVHPCRASTCLHLQCFDSYLYLQMNEKKAKWMCPVCDKPALFSNLVIDGYFQEVLQSTTLPSDSNEIELNKDGSWNVQQKVEPSNHRKAIEPTECIEIICDDDSDPPPLEAPPPPTWPAAVAAAPVHSSVMTFPEIVISDTDDEEEGGAEGGGQQPQQQIVSNVRAQKPISASPIAIITLSSTSSSASSSASSTSSSASSSSSSSSSSAASLPFTEMESENTGRTSASTDKIPVQMEEITGNECDGYVSITSSPFNNYSLNTKSIPQDLNDDNDLSAFLM